MGFSFSAFLLSALPSSSVFTFNLKVTALIIQCQPLGPPNSLSVKVYICKTYRTCTFCVRTLFQMTVWQIKCFWIGKNRLACKCCQKYWIFLEGRHFGYFSWQKITEGYFSKYKILSLWKMLSSSEECKVYSHNTGTQPPDTAKVGTVLSNQNWTLYFNATNKVDWRKPLQLSKSLFLGNLLAENRISYT